MEQGLIHAPIRRMLLAKAARGKIPLSGTFELTPRCNMNCKMCYIRMSEEEMLARGREIPAQEWIHLGEVCRDAGMLFLLLTGGEPLLRPDFREIYEALNKMGLLISINSNGTMITEEIALWLGTMPPARVNVTLYGGCNETYQKLCGNPHGFDQAVRGIRLLREAGVHVVINASFTRLNVGDMEAIYATARKFGIPVREAVYMFPPVRSAKEGRVDEMTRFSPEEAGEALYRAKECGMDPERFREMRQRVVSGLPEVWDCEECSRSSGEPMGCTAGRSSFWITWDGRMTPCGMMNEPVTNPFAEGFSAAWQRLVHETGQIRLPPECTGCKWRSACMLCGALAIAEGNGDATKKPEYLCRMTGRYIRRCMDT